MFEKLDEGQAAAIEDGHLQVIDLDIGVVDAHAVQHAEQVLSGRDQHALAHEAGGVTDAGHVLPEGLDRESVKIRPHEDDPCGGWCG